jgi:hypothetical protein
MLHPVAWNRESLGWDWKRVRGAGAERGDSGEGAERMGRYGAAPDT